MDNTNVTTEEKQCPKCKEHESERQMVGIALLVILFFGPMVGMLIGLFAGKKIRRY